MSRLQHERIDLFHGLHVKNESHKLPGHEQRMSAHERRIQGAIGPVTVRERGSRNQPCRCSVCEDYRRTRTRGPHYLG